MSDPLELARYVTPALRTMLERHRFDDTRLREQARLLAEVGYRPEAAQLASPPLPPPPEVMADLPPVGSVQRREAEALGRDAIESGRLASVVLAGGMATRFGGVVKAATECLPGRTFLDLKLSDLAATSASIRRVLMVSYATDVAVRAELARLGRKAETFTQSVSLRLTREGRLFLEGGEPSPYAPGHGDLLDALLDTGTLHDLREAGVRTILVSNVDNLGASADPALLGMHLARGLPVTVEVVTRGALDRGGAPGIVEGRVEIVEAFRFPPGSDVDGFDTFNTNTLWMDLESLERRFALDDFPVLKKVEGREAVQYERLVGQVTHFLDSLYVRVPRGGSEGRFLPVKDPEELDLRRGEIEARLRAQGVL